VASKQKPVVKAASGDAIKATILAISSIDPHRFIGILSVMYFLVSRWQGWEGNEISVSQV
jgi:hypothetical protein